jgi:hypothetical protein
VPVPLPLPLLALLAEAVARAEGVAALLALGGAVPLALRLPALRPSATEPTTPPAAAKERAISPPHEVTEIICRLLTVLKPTSILAKNSGLMWHTPRVCTRLTATCINTFHCSLRRRRRRARPAQHASRARSRTRARARAHEAPRRGRRIERPRVRTPPPLSQAFVLSPSAPPRSPYVICARRRGRDREGAARRAPRARAILHLFDPSDVDALCVAGANVVPQLEEALFALGAWVKVLRHRARVERVELPQALARKGLFALGHGEPDGRRERLERARARAARARAQLGDRARRAARARRRLVAAAADVVVAVAPPRGVVRGAPRELRARRRRRREGARERSGERRVERRAQRARRAAQRRQEHRPRGQRRATVPRSHPSVGHQ